MTKQNLYIDIHALQSVPVSNINRDDNGEPKSAMYGGAMRARVSSQSWKHAMRDGFKHTDITSANRTKMAAKLLADNIQKVDSSLDDEAAMKKSEEAFKLAGVKVDKEGNTGALLMVSPGQITKLAQYVVSNDELDKKAIKAVLKGDQSLDLALFGRMVADNPELNVDASAQVAHAISTHRVEPDYDYFTALDDLQPKDTAGAAMLGSIQYNSSTLYRYANLNMHELIHNLGTEDAFNGASEFVKQFLLSMPTGKQNTFANKTLPNYVMVVVRTDTPVNLVSAFEKPVPSTEDGYVTASITKLEKEYTSTLSMVEKPILKVVLNREDSTSDGQVENLTELLNKVTESLKEAVQDEDTDD